MQVDYYYCIISKSNLQHQQKYHQLLVLLLRMQIPPSPSSNIEETYCIPLKDIRLGFQAPKLHVQLDRQNILIKLFKHPKIVKLESQLDLIKQQKLPSHNRTTQTPISTVLQQFIYHSEIKEVEKEGRNISVVVSEQLFENKQIKYSNYCNTLIQTMLTGKMIDSLEQSTNVYIKSLESKVSELQQVSPFKKKRQGRKEFSTSPIFSRLESVSIEVQTDEEELADSQLLYLEEELSRLRSTLQASSRDNLFLIEAKNQLERIVKTQHQQITQMHAEISKITLENSRLKSRDLILSRKVVDQPVREKESIGGSKKALGEVKLVELEALQEENRVLRHYIEAVKAESPIKLMKKESLKNIQIQIEDDQVVVQSLDQLDELKKENKNIKQKYSLALKRITQLEQSIEINQVINGKAEEKIAERSIKQNIQQIRSFGFQKQIVVENSTQSHQQSSSSIEQVEELWNQNKQLQEDIKILTRELAAQRQYSGQLKTQNQTMIMDMKRTTMFGQEQYTKLNYKRLLEMHQEQSKDLKNSEMVIVGLREIIRQYQQVIDNEGDSQKQLDRATDEQAVQKLNYFSQMIQNQLQYLNELINQRPATERNDDMSMQLERAMYQLKKQHSKRALLENKLERLSHTLMEYEEEILEKTARISDLNYTILQLQQKSRSEVSVDFSDDYSNYSNNHAQYEYQTVKDFRKTKYDQTPIQHSVSEEDTITESRIKHQLEGREQDIKFLKATTNFKREEETLKALIDRNSLSNKEKLELILLIVQSVEKNISIWRFKLTSNNILVKLKKQEIRVDLHKDDANNLYASPEELYQSKSQNSTVWRLGVILDELVHGSMFFESMQEIADTKILYKFRSKQPELEPVRKFLGKALVKNSSLRISMLKFLSGIKLELKSRQY